MAFDANCSDRQGSAMAFFYPGKGLGFRHGAIRRSERCGRSLSSVALGLVVGVTLTACRDRPQVATAAATAGAVTGKQPAAVLMLESQEIGQPMAGKPWIAHLATGDLDGDGRDDVITCEAREGRIGWISPDGNERVLADHLPAPVHTEIVDIDQDGDRDVLVACMGEVFPNNARIGSVVLLENDGAQRLTPRTLLADVARVTDVRAADLDADGRLDLVLAQFGYDQGEVAWMRNRGDGRYDREVLLNLSGAINVEIADMNGDRMPDIVTVVAQQWEEVYLLENRGSGGFSRKVIFASTNEDYGSSGIRLVDMNRDGRPDVLYSNGDGFDYAEPGARPWHGVQWLENRGDGYFAFHRIGDLPGAYSPVALDLNGDGALDVVACSGFNRWTEPGAVSLRAFLNDGAFNFTPVDLAVTPTHLMCLTTARWDGDTATPTIVSGGFHAYPPWDRMSRVMAWRVTATP